MTDHDSFDFNARLLHTLAPYEKVLVYQPGAVLFRQDFEPEGVHVLLAGEVDLSFSGKNEAVPVHFTVTGQVLGLSSIVSGRTHEYTTTAATQVTSGFVDRETFFRILHQAPAHWFDVLQVLSADIVSCYDRVKQLASRTRP